MKSKILQKDHEDMIELYRKMKPEERLMAYFHHSQLVQQFYQAGLTFRTSPPSSPQKHEI